MKSQNDHQPTFMERFRFMASFYALTLLPHDPVTRPHWNEIIPGLILGGLPIQSSFLGHGNHGEKLINQCLQDERPLSLIVSAIEQWELEGQGIGLRPVSAEYWAKNNIERHHLNMQDFTGDVDLKEIKKEVDAIHQARAKGNSAYVHCKAGRGRSYLVVFCYLMLHEGMDANKALKTIYGQRPQVSPSGRQFATIEDFRKKYCSKNKPLNTDSDAFYPYRKDVLSFGHSANIYGAVISAGTYLLSRFGIGTSAIAGFAITKGTEYAQNWHSDYQETQYVSMLVKAKSKLQLETSQVESFNVGYKSSVSWKEWAKSWMNSSTYLNGYTEFSAGYRAGKEHDMSLHQKINQQTKSRKSTKVS